MEVRARIDKIIAEHLATDPEKVVPDASLIDDLLADSLDIVELVMAFEEEFGIEITDDETDEIERVEHCYDKVEPKVVAKAA